MPPPPPTHAHTALARRSTFETVCWFLFLFLSPLPLYGFLCSSQIWFEINNLQLPARASSIHYSLKWIQNKLQRACKPGDTSHKTLTFGSLFTIYHAFLTHTDIHSYARTLVRPYSSLFKLTRARTHTHISHVACHTNTGAPTGVCFASTFFTCPWFFSSLAWLWVCRVPHRNHVANSKHDTLSNVCCFVCYTIFCLLLLLLLSCFLHAISMCVCKFGWTRAHFFSCLSENLNILRKIRWNSGINEPCKSAEMTWYDVTVCVLRSIIIWISQTGRQYFLFPFLIYLTLYSALAVRSRFFWHSRSCRRMARIRVYHLPMLSIKINFISKSIMFFR